MRDLFSATRFGAVLVKEFIQMVRDRTTFAMMVGVPLLQLLLFGYAINSDPRNMPMAVVAGDNGPFTRVLLRAMENTTYFKVIAFPDSAEKAESMLARGEVQFVLRFPPDFNRRLARGERPVLLLEADASDPVATSGPIAALAALQQNAFARDLVGPLHGLQPGATPFEFRVHRMFNPEGITAYNIVPALMGTILTMTLAMITAAAMTREFERGTMENLLATPVRPVEVMLAKILPYVFVGLVQVAVILSAARLLFGVPFEGSLLVLIPCVLVFIAANLAVGFSFSTLARTQVQAMQMASFYFLPSMLLSGFLFPFRAMPGWAQFVGEALPLTHFLRIARGVMLKGSGWAEVWPDLWPLLIIALIVAAIALKRYRQTLD